MLRALACLPCLALPGCLLTQALWAPSGRVNPAYRYAATECELIGARGVVDPTAVATQIVLQVEAAPDGPIEHSRHWNPGWLKIWPAPLESGWLLAASDQIRPEQIDVAFFGADNFGGRAVQNAIVTMSGRADAALFGGCTDLAVPSLEFAPFTLGPQWERDALESLAQHDWAEILGMPPAGELRPLAWLDSQGRPCGAAPPESSPREFDLLIQIGPDRARIPARVLTGSHGQQLRRDGDSIAWQYVAAWRYSPVGAAAGDNLPELGIPWRTRLLRYEWGAALPDPASPFWTTVKVVVTPVAAALDVMIEFAPPLKRFVSWLLGKPPEVVVSPGRR